MNMYSLEIDSPIVGGYFSSEQIDLLSIIQCQSIAELQEFLTKCDQINHISGLADLLATYPEEQQEEAKRLVFEAYQDTMVYHTQSKEDSRIRRLQYLGLSQEELMKVIEKTHPQSEEILSLNHHFVSEERDQLKSDEMYSELSTINAHLPFFNSMLIGSGKIYNVVNKYNRDKKFDFYHAERDLNFAHKNGKQVRYHALLVKDDCGLFEGKSKEQIKELIKEYVKASIDFINDYNKSHEVEIDGQKRPVINAVDIFNEIVSFEKNDKGEYYNIWEEKYGITMPELVEYFKYALENKPQGVAYLYNEPFLEDDQRRQKVIEVLKEINNLSPGLIDTLGSQMHITITQDLEGIRRSFADFKQLQTEGYNIQITEFDMSLGRTEINRVFGPNATVSLEQVYQEKGRRVGEISRIVRDSGVKLQGVSYWSLTDGVDCNLERIRTNPNNSHVQTACGGLIGTHKKLIRQSELGQMFTQQNQPQSSQQRTTGQSSTPSTPTIPQKSMTIGSKPPANNPGGNKPSGNAS